jgi:hypothetical protein
MAEDSNCASCILSAKYLIEGMMRFLRHLISILPLMVVLAFLPSNVRAALYLDISDLNFVGFDQAIYEGTVGEPLVLQILFDSDITTPANEPHPNGLNCVSVGMAFNPTDLVFDGLSSIAIVPELDSDGAGNPPLKEINAADIGFAGAVALGMPPYGDTLLATITLTPLSEGRYDLSLGQFFHSGPATEFLDGTGADLIPTLYFGNAVIRVSAVPEPTVLSMILIGLFFGLGRFLVRKSR